MFAQYFEYYAIILGGGAFFVNTLCIYRALQGPHSWPHKNPKTACTISTNCQRSTDSKIVRNFYGKTTR